ncbi:3,4-dihydroxy-2-butanone-4-phosphate synthase [Demequina sp. NBRC 110052]|uniref:3,4-dihydroxy-2-butanone-4-phosphate synthase n=1 Tax=Demequina sp. NBRC 110052 TaxID=1570341 RepID=UPI000A0526F6|nr:3,4-dihydroxy-2-butanone-4-phosphate synthase [Demequina sp. NBRC 110052]
MIAVSSSTVEAAIAAVASGEPVVVTDHPDREDEGDLVVAAEFATRDVIAFMMDQCRGLICAPVTEERAIRLGLDPMVRENTEMLRTAFTVPVDAADGVTTGISADDRAATIAVLADPLARSSNLVRPGHMFPLIASPGGVRARRGHTEAAIDLAVLAGLSPVAVICEIASADGTMLRGQALREFSAKHHLVQISIDELVEHMAAIA